jgi:dual specificity phosphatase 3
MNTPPLPHDTPPLPHDTPSLPHDTPSLPHDGSTSAESRLCGYWSSRADLPTSLLGASMVDHAQPDRPANPQGWWRVPCQVTDRVYISGDLDTFRPERGAAQLQEWLELGVTDIIDVRNEWNDATYVAKLAPAVRYHHFGTDDLDNGQPAEWFAKGVSAALEALQDPQRRVMVHCHMGVNRGPSMAFAILLALGMAPVEALDAVRASRPIAGIIYAVDALTWWHHNDETPLIEAAHDQIAVSVWHMKNPVDVSWIVSRIHQEGYSS